MLGTILVFIMHHIVLKLILHFSAFECDTSKGLMFDECGPVCPRTCESIQVVQANMTETCFKPCVASCQCTADKVLHGGRCISPQDCPYIETVPIL